MSNSIENRYDFVLLFDVMDGNPNGDPDNANLPRMDAQTGEGLVTDVCLKRKIRNYVDMMRGTESGYEIYVREGAVLNTTLNEALKSAAEVLPKSKDDKKMSDADKKRQAGLLMRRSMCNRYFDIRTFGAVLSTGDNSGSASGQVRGPVQFTFARSVGPVLASDWAITRMAITDEKDAAKERTMGRKHTIPYGLYRTHGFINAGLAQGDRGTGFSDDDLSLLWEAIENMFENDRSAARGLMSVRGLYIFKHDSKYGNAPAHALFERITIERVKEVPRQFTDFRVTINRADLPKEVKLIERAVNQPQKVAA